jgi:hypothetical protein
VNDAPSADRLAQRPVLPAPPSADGKSSTQDSPASAGLFSFVESRSQAALEFRAAAAMSDHLIPTRA